MTGPSAYGFSAEAVEVAHDIRRQWEATGLRGAFCARNIDTGEELGLDPDDAYPLASVTKLPLALVALDRIARGELHGDRQLELVPDERTPGPDAIFELIPPRVVTDALAGWGLDGVVVRHPMRMLFDAVHSVAPDDRIAVAALTASTVPAMLQPEADRAIGFAAREAFDVLRL